jgi:hypothetical protein
MLASANLVRSILFHGYVSLIRLAGGGQTPAMACYLQNTRKGRKSKMSVINAVRYKLLARVVSVVKNDREYVKKTA